MQDHNGTSILNWDKYEKEARRLTDEQLLYSIKDCKAAESSGIEYATYPCKASGFYSDLKSVYVSEYNRRKR